MAFQDVAYLPLRASFSTTFHKNFGRGESLGTTTCRETMVGHKQGHAICEPMVGYEQEHVTCITMVGGMQGHAICRTMFGGNQRHAT